MIKMIDMPFSDNNKLDELPYLFFVKEGRKKEALSEIAMTEKPKMDQLRMMLQVGEGLFQARSSAYWSSLGLWVSKKSMDGMELWILQRFVPL